MARRRTLAESPTRHARASAAQPLPRRRGEERAVPGPRRAARAPRPLCASYWIALALGPVAAGRRGAMLAGGLDPDEVGDAVRTHRIDVVHAHNIHPLLGWRALAAARSAGARTVLHLHNFRLFCAIGVAYRDGAAVLSLPRSRHGARAALALPRLAGRGGRLRGRPASPAAADLRARRPVRRPSAAPPRTGWSDSACRATGSRCCPISCRGLRRRQPRCARRRTRWSPAAWCRRRAIDTAIAACRGWPAVPLVVAGEGPDALAAASAGRAAPMSASSGASRADELARLRARGGGGARAVALGGTVPVRGARRPGRRGSGARQRPGRPARAGAIPRRVVAGARVRDWAAALSELWHDPDLRGRRGAAALAHAHEQFGESAYYDRLMRLYEQAV